MKFRDFIALFYALIVISLIYSLPALAVVKVGNGGDVIAAQLLSTAKVLREVLIAETRGTNALTQACSESAELNDAQKKECQNFALAALRDVLPLLLNNSTPLLLTRELIEVPGPDGKPRPVQAYTQCAGDFPITFAFDSVKLFTPSQILQLLSHEFGHKVRFQNGDCLGDDLPAGAFDKPGGSRVLLDTFGVAVVSAALKLNLITEEVGVQDIFKCIWKLREFEFKQTVFTKRRFLKRGNFDSYVAGIFDENLDACSQQLGESTFAVRLAISEPEGCNFMGSQSRRSTAAQLLKFETDPNSSTGVKIQTLEERIFPNENKLCTGSNFPPEELLFKLPRAQGVNPKLEGIQIFNDDVVEVRLEYVGSETMFLWPRPL